MADQPYSKPDYRVHLVQIVNLKAKSGDPDKTACKNSQIFFALLLYFFVAHTQCIDWAWNFFLTLVILSRYRQCRRVRDTLLQQPPNAFPVTGKFEL